MEKYTFTFLLNQAKKNSFRREKLEHSSAFSVLIKRDLDLLWLGVCVSLAAMNECLKLAGLLSFLILASCTHQAGDIHMPSRGGHRVLTQAQKESNKLAQVTKKEQVAKADSSQQSITLKPSAWENKEKLPSDRQRKQLDESRILSDLQGAAPLDFSAHQGRKSIEVPDVSLPSMLSGDAGGSLKLPELQNITPVSKPVGALRHHDYAAQEENKSVGPGAPYRPNSAELNGMRSPRLLHELPLKQ